MFAETLDRIETTRTVQKQRAGVGMRSDTLQESKSVADSVRCIGLFMSNRKTLFNYRQCWRQKKWVNGNDFLKKSCNCSCDAR